MKTTLTFLFLLIAFNLGFSQSKEIQLTSDKKLLEYSFFDNGSVYLLTGKIPKFSPVASEKKLLLYTSDLDKKSDIDLTTISKNVNAIFTPSGNLLGFNQMDGLEKRDDKITDSYYSTSKDYTLVKSKDSKGPIKTLLRKFYTDDYQIYYGKIININENKKKRGEDYANLYFYRMDVKNFKGKLVKINFPTQSFPNSKMFYQYQSHTNEKVFFILNELLDEGKKNVCNLVSFDYDGKLIDQIPFTLELENKGSFSHSNVFGSTTDENYVWELPNGRDATFQQRTIDGTTVKVKIDPSGQSFYTYGYARDNNEKRSLITSYYIYKYDFSGKNLWKIETRMDPKKYDSDYDINNGTDDNLVFINNNRIAFWNRENYTKDTEFSIIDASNGQVVQTKNIELIGNRNTQYPQIFGLLSNLELRNIPKKIKLDMNTIFAMNFSAEVEKYVISRPSSKFVARLNEKGIYLLEENNKEDTYKLLKFDW